MMKNQSIRSTRSIRPRGFTLIELLVVVGIILVLSAIALPTFTSLFKGKALPAAGGVLQSAVRMARSGAAKRNREQILVFFEDTTEAGINIKIVDPGASFADIRRDLTNKLYNDNVQFVGRTVTLPGGVDFDKTYFKSNMKLYTEPTSPGEVTAFFNQLKSDFQSVSPGLLVFTKNGRIDEEYYDDKPPLKDGGGISIYNPDSDEINVTTETPVCDLRVYDRSAGAKRVLVVDFEPGTGGVESKVMFLPDL